MRQKLKGELDQVGNTVRSLVGRGIPQKQICRLVVNRQTQKPLDHKTLRKHFAHEIAIGTAELHALIGKFMLATIFGTPPPAGIVAIDDQRARGSLLRFFAETRMARERRGLYPDPDAVAANARLAQIRRYSRPV